jgi:RNA polymerase sigma-70 factor (ECF subfamily)
LITFTEYYLQDQAMPYAKDKNITPDIIALFAQGSEQGMRIIFKALFTKLKFYAQGIIHHEQEAEDIVMAAFQKLWLRRDSYTSQEHIERFLHTVVHNTCIDYLSHERVKAEKHQNIKYAATQSEDFIENRYVRAELLHLIYQEIDQLPPKCREVIKWHFIHGLTLAEVATKMSLTESTIRSQKARGLELLKGTLLQKNMLELYSFLVVGLAVVEGRFQA